MLNFGYHSARTEGAVVRRVYLASLSAIVRRPVQPSGELPFEVFSYSGESALPEQIASIRSLLRYAGRPKKFTVVSDGSYTPRSLALIRALDRCVSVAPCGEWIPANVPSDARSYLTGHPTGKQLALIMSLPNHGPALYVDSDVLFFPGAIALQRWSGDDFPVRYLADCQLSADERLFRSAAEKLNPLNTGVLFLARGVDWSIGMERLLELAGEPTFFTNQTITHLALHAAGAQPFDPKSFVLQLDDQFVYPDRYAAPAITLRHYVNPVRHKFWTTLRRQRF